MHPSIFTNLRFALRGLRTVWMGERSFRIEVIASALILGGAFVFDFTFLETLIVMFAIALVLGAEMLNTVIEETLDIVQPNHDPRVGKAKDIMAGAVLFAGFGGVLLILFTVAYHLRR